MTYVSFPWWRLGGAGVARERNEEEVKMHAAGFQCAACGEWVETSVDESAGFEAAVCGGQPGLLSAERVDGAMEQLGTGVYDHGGAGELVFLKCHFAGCSSKDKRRF